MAYSDEENTFYGTPLEPYDEDEVPARKPLKLEDQIATDSSGRRRFHGAFTGGFSAGFCNTVGSLEGWAPQEFKSSRDQKASHKAQRPEDFMDDEDVAEHGFAPSRVRQVEDYSSVGPSRKRRCLPTQGPIPGRPVLELLLQPAKETIGIKLLKQMGWRMGQGVGPRLSKSNKKRMAAKQYTCEMPPGFKRVVNEDESEDSDDEEDITFAPDDYHSYVCQPKENTCGMGYVGLNKMTFASTNLNKEAHFMMMGKDNKKLHIFGQGFGVGALEEDDDDIYMKDDLSRYDFELGSKSKADKQKDVTSGRCTFVPAVHTISTIKNFPPPTLPSSFKAVHGVRISRFEPLPEKQTPKTVSRHVLNSLSRSEIINDKIEVKKIPPFVVNNLPNSVSSNTEQSAPIKQSLTVKTASVENCMLTNENFKPFIYDPEKQKRYDEYLRLKNSGQHGQLNDIHPVAMTEWERQREKDEFEQAAKMFKPLMGGLVLDRFVTANQVEDLNNPLASTDKLDSKYVSHDMKEAARQKLFGKLTRETIDWQPEKILCVRFNVPEPVISYSGPQPRKIHKTGSIFDYLEASRQNTLTTVTEKISNTESISEKIVTPVSESDTRLVAVDPVSNKKESPKNENFVEIINDDIPISNDRGDDRHKTNVQPQEQLRNKESISNAQPRDDPQAQFRDKESAPNVQHRDKQDQPQKQFKNKESIPIDLVVLNTEKKIDLFKAIFLSSSSESEDNDAEEEAVIPPEDKIDKAVTPSSGIFACLDKIHYPPQRQNQIEVKNLNNIAPLEKNVLQNISKSNEADPQENKLTSVIDSNIYGPKLPSVPIKSASYKSSYVNRSEPDEIWLEKSDQLKKKKKKKDIRHKHKKHKTSSKHKKKRHSK